MTRAERQGRDHVEVGHRRAAGVDSLEALGRLIDGFSDQDRYGDRVLPQPVANVVRGNLLSLGELGLAHPAIQGGAVENDVKRHLRPLRSFTGLEQHEALATVPRAVTKLEDPALRRLDFFCFIRSFLGDLRFLCRTVRRYPRDLRSFGHEVSHEPRTEDLHESGEPLMAVEQQPLRSTAVRERRDTEPSHGFMSRDGRRSGPEQDGPHGKATVETVEQVAALLGAPGRLTARALESGDLDVTPHHLLDDLVQGLDVRLALVERHENPPIKWPQRSSRPGSSSRTTRRRAGTTRRTRRAARRTRS